MPYYLASLWDSHYAQKEQNKGTHKPSLHKGALEQKSQIPKELRRRLKRARAARGLLQDLEEDVRMFIKKWNEKQQSIEDAGLDVLSSSGEGSSEDEIVFVGRSGQMLSPTERKERLKKLKEDMYIHHERDGEKLVFDSLVNDRGGVFG